MHSWTVCRSTCLPFIVCRYMCICKYVFLLLTPIQQNGVKEEGEGQGEGAPDSSPQTQCLLPQGWGRTMMTPSIILYVLYSARNVFKTIIGCDCYPLLVLRLPNDFLFHSEPKVARWDPLHQYWTTNSVLGVDVNMGGWGWGWGGR